MKQVLEPLANIPGVRMALLVSHDGVPVVVRGRAGEDGGVDLSSESGESLAALASGWLNGITRSLAPQSWDAPQRVVLRAARGTLPVQELPRPPPKAAIVQVGLPHVAPLAIPVTSRASGSSRRGPQGPEQRQEDRHHHPQREMQR